ncbi:MAG: hypothetical protein V4537_14270 [Pseudomonadota bacterium]
MEVEPDVLEDKRKDLAKHTTARRKVREKMQPFKDQVKELTDKIDILERDIDEGTEEQEHLVYQEMDFKRNEVRTFLHPEGELAERRTMTSEDRQHDLTQREKERLNNNNPKREDQDGEEDEAAE